MVGNACGFAAPLQMFVAKRVESTAQIGTRPDRPLRIRQRLLVVDRRALSLGDVAVVASQISISRCDGNGDLSSDSDIAGRYVWKDALCHALRDLPRFNCARDSLLLGVALMTTRQLMTTTKTSAYRSNFIPSHVNQIKTARRGSIASRARLERKRASRSNRPLTRGLERIA